MDIRSRPRLPQGNSAWPEDGWVCARSVTVVLPRGTKECGGGPRARINAAGWGIRSAPGAYTDDQGIQLPGDSGPPGQGRWGYGGLQSTEHGAVLDGAGRASDAHRLELLCAPCSVLPPRD